jgi:hypothetical protein
MSIGIKGANGTVANGSITNVKLADVPQDTFKGRVASGTGVPKDLSIVDFTGVLPVNGDFVLGFNASGGLKTFVADKLLNTMSTAVTSASSPSIDVDSMQQYNITALASAVSFPIPSGTPTNGQKLIIRIKDNGTARAITWDAIFRGVNLTLPAITIVGDTLYLEAYYNSTDSKWDIVKVTTAVTAGVTGSGTADYLARWTPSGTVLGNSIIRDDGTNVGVGIAPDSSSLMYLYTASLDNGINLYNSKGSANATGIWATADGATGINNIGLRGSAVNATTGRNIGVYGEFAMISTLGLSSTLSGGQGSGGVFTSARATGKAFGVVGIAGATANQASATNVGGLFKAINAGTNYAIQLQDGTQGAGKFLKSITADGEANWASITASDVSGIFTGGGTTNFVARWTSGTALGDGSMRDNGSTTSIGDSLNPDIKLLVYKTDSAGAGSAIAGLNNSTNAGINVGVNGQSYGTAPSGTNVGGYFFASGGANNYAIKLQDGTQGSGKFLKSIDADGNANWATITSSDIGSINTNRILGRYSAGVGAVQELQIGSGLSLSGGGTLSASISGSGTADYLARWTPNGTTLGNGIFRDNGTTAGINTAPQATSLISTTSNLNITIDSNNSKSTGDPVVISAVMNGGATTTTSTGIKSLVGDTTGIAYGIYSEYQKLTGSIADSTFVSAGDGVAGYFKAFATTGNVYGVIGVASPVGSQPSATNIGGRFYAKFGGSNYSVQLQDGTEGSGKFLKSVSADGKANWASILVSDITNSTSLALGLGSIELGHATDTTITRVSAGVIAVEGVTVATATNTLTLTNKRITSRVQSVTSASTVTPNADSDDSVEITAQAAALTIASPSGTPTSHQKLIIRIKDNATARAITWNAIYRAIGVTLPTTTVISKTMYLGFIYNVADTKWDCVAVNQEA